MTYWTAAFQDFMTTTLDRLKRLEDGTAESVIEDEPLHSAMFTAGQLHAIADLVENTVALKVPAVNDRVLTLKVVVHDLNGERVVTVTIDPALREPMIQFEAAR